MSRRKNFSGRDQRFAIRPATPGDLPRVAAMAYGLQRYHQGLRPGFYTPLQDFVERWKEYGERLLSEDESRVFLAEVDGQPAGQVIVRLHQRPPVVKGERWGVILELFVKEPYRGTGIGRALLDAASRWCHERGASRLTAKVDTLNTDALRFYQAAGFQEYKVQLYMTLEAPSPRELEEAAQGKQERTEM